MPAVSSFLLAGAIGAGIFSASEQRKAAKKAQKQFEQTLVTPDPPIVQGKTGEAGVKKKLVKSGRGGTILTGQLIPQNIGKSRLLG